MLELLGIGGIIYAIYAIFVEKDNTIARLQTRLSDAQTEINELKRCKKLAAYEVIELRKLRKEVIVLRENANLTLPTNMVVLSTKLNKDGYPSQWSIVSSEYKHSQGYICEDCGVDLTNNKSLLHTHHLNREKQDCTDSNLTALCVDCHSKQNGHGWMRDDAQHHEAIKAVRLIKSLQNK